ncbi:Ribonuclease MRP protein subunit rmp1 [Oleoguttula sp. CCFEE 5521]
MRDSFAPLNQIQLDDLTHFSSLLRLFHHRNKNQHRRSIWYRHFSTFHRQLTKLLNLHSTVSATPTTHTERAKHKARLPELRIRITQTLDLWQDVLVPKWAHTFGQLIADGQFAVLGMVLTGALAGVCGTLGINARLERAGVALEEAEQAEMVKVLQTFEREIWADDGVDGAAVVSRVAVLASTEPVGNDGDDLGVPLERVPSDAVHAPGATSVRQSTGTNVAVRAPVVSLQSPQYNATLTKSASPRPASKSIKKKRKRGDAIDDLFGGL